MPSFPAGVQGFIEWRVLVEPRVVLKHDRVNNSGFRGCLDDLRPILVMRREADEPGFARLPDRIRRFLQLLPLHHLDRGVEGMIVSQTMNHIKINIISSECGEPFIHHGGQIEGAHHVLGDQEFCLRTSRFLGEPLLNRGSER